MDAKHFVIYYQRGAGTFVVTEPRPWARENQHHFPNFTFQPNNHPTPIEIEKWLITMMITTSTTTHLTRAMALALPAAALP